MRSYLPAALVLLAACAPGPKIPLMTPCARSPSVTSLWARRGHRDVWFARWIVGGGWTALPGLKGGADDGAIVSRFRPSVARVGEGVRAVFQDLTPGKNALHAVTVSLMTGIQALAPERLDDTVDAANQLTRPRLVSTGSGNLLLFENDRSG